MLLWGLFIVVGLFCRPWWGVALAAVGMGVFGFLGATGQGLEPSLVVAATALNLVAALVVGFVARFVGEKLWGKAIKPPKASMAGDVLRQARAEERQD